MKTTVAKFGGTSLADAGQFRKVKDIVLSDPARRIIVASAPGKRYPEDIKVTDLLLQCYEKAVAGQNYSDILLQISKRFEDIISALSVDIDISKDMMEIEEHLASQPQKCYMASRGEYLNSKILAAYLDFTFVDPAWCVFFHENGTLDAETTRRTMAASLRPLKNAVVAGFYGSKPDGSVQTFTRGGSDITGSLAAKAIGADLYENWTDVSGLLTADPRLVDHPKTVDYLSYRELRTLSYMGATVLHTDAVLPACTEGIPINIRNTNAPEDAGTMIVNRLPEGRERAAVTGVAGRTGMSVIQVEKVMVSDGAGFSAIMLDILKSKGVPFEQCLTGIDTVSLVIRSDMLEPYKEEILNEIQEKLSPDALITKENLSMIAVVGESESGSYGATVRILRAVADAGVEISTINQGAGDLNLLIGVAEENYKRAIRAIYESIEK